MENRLLSCTQIAQQGHLGDILQTIDVVHHITMRRVECDLGAGQAPRVQSALSQLADGIGSEETAWRPAVTNAMAALEHSCAGQRQRAKLLNVFTVNEGKHVV